MIVKIEYCRQCGEARPLGFLSNRGYCQSCSKGRITDAVTQMQEKSGPLYDKWLTNYLAAMSGVIERLSE